MTGADINEAKYSIFTMSLLEDTGWYNVDYSMADPFEWGKGKGCNFPKLKCNAPERFSEFCWDTSLVNCDASGNLQTHCAADKYSD